MQEIYSIVLVGEDEKTKMLMQTIQPYSLNSRYTKSCTGIEIATFVVSALELLVMLICIPVVSDAINSRKLLVNFDGYTFNDTAQGLLHRLKKDPKLMNSLKNAYISGSLKLEGSTNQIIAFREAIEEFLANEGQY